MEKQVGASITEARLSPVERLQFDYLSFPQENRTAVLKALQYATTHVPTELDCYYAAIEYGYADYRIEMMYGDVADAYALSICPTFLSDNLMNTDSEVASFRHKFYWMIRELTAEQITASISRIKELENA